MRNIKSYLKFLSFVLVVGAVCSTQSMELKKEELKTKLKKGDPLFNMNILMTFEQPPEETVPSCGAGDVKTFARFLFFYAQLVKKANVKLRLHNWKWLGKFFDNCAIIPFVTTKEEKGFIPLDVREFLDCVSQVKDINEFVCDYKYLHEGTKAYEKVGEVAELFEMEDITPVIVNRSCKYYDGYLAPEHQYLNERSLSREHIECMVQGTKATVFNITGIDQKEANIPGTVKLNTVWKNYKSPSSFVNDAIAMSAATKIEGGRIISVDTAILNGAVAVTNYSTEKNVIGVFNQKRNTRFEDMFLKNNSNLELIVAQEHNEFGSVVKTVNRKLQILGN